MGRFGRGGGGRVGEGVREGRGGRSFEVEFGFDVSFGVDFLDCYGGSWGGGRASGGATE